MHFICNKHQVVQRQIERLQKIDNFLSYGGKLPHLSGAAVLACSDTRDPHTERQLNSRALYTIGSVQQNKCFSIFIAKNEKKNPHIVFIYNFIPN